MPANSAGITIPISANTKQYDTETKRLVKDAKNLQKSLDIKFDGKQYAEAQRLMSEAIERTNQKAVGLKQKLTDLENSGKINSDEYKKLNSELIKVEAEATQLKQKLAEVNQLKIDNIVNGFKNVGDKISAAGQALIPFSAAAAGVIAALGAISKSAITAGDYIGTTAQQLNIGTTALQKWLYIAEQTDVDSTQFVTSITKIQNALGHLAIGEADITATVLEQLGFSQEQAAKGMSENFEPIIDALAGVEDATVQAYYANELFGSRMAAKIIPLLNDGGQGLQALGEQFQSLGYLSEETVTRLDVFEDVIDRIKYQFTLVKNEIGASFLPLMEAMANVVETKVVPVFKSLSDWFQTLDVKQQATMLSVLAFTAALAPTLLIMGKLTSMTGSMIGSVLKLAGSFSTLNASLGVIGLIAAVIALLYMKNEKFRESINELVGTIGSALMPILSILGEAFKTIMVVLDPIIQMLGDQLAVSIKMISTILTPILGMLTNILVPVINIVLKGIQMLVSVLMGPLSKAFSWVSGLWIGIFEKIQKGIQWVLDWIAKAINSGIELINKLIRGINSIGEHLGFSLQELSDVKIKLDVGGSPSVINKATSQPLSSVDKAISNSTSNQTTNNVVTTNNDYSQKDIVVNVTVENYGAEVDVKDLVKKINTELAGNF
ncbi:MAG: hypothetical protein ABII85_01855 [Bacillota bacterium]